MVTTDKLQITEIFYSIQGEGSRSGRPCIFIRLTGCDLRCSYCDSEYAFSEGAPQTFLQILNAVKSYPCRLVEVTGGEPLNQPLVYNLMTMLCDEGYEVLLETGGHVSINRVDSRVHKIVDIKTPGSGMVSRNDPRNVGLGLEEIRSGKLKTEFKFVICSREDYQWAKAFLETHNLAGTFPVYFSSASPNLSAEKLAEWVLEDGLNITFQIQLHKALWPNLTRGV